LLGAGHVTQPWVQTAYFMYCSLLARTYVSMYTKVRAKNAAGAKRELSKYPMVSWVQSC